MQEVVPRAVSIAVMSMLMFLPYILSTCSLDRSMVCPSYYNTPDFSDQCISQTKK